MVTATIELEGTGSTCVKAEPVTTIYTEGGRVVRWFIYNGCSKPVTLRVTNFAEKLTRGAFDPFSSSDKPGTCTADPGKLCKPFPRGTIGGAGPNGGHGAFVFTYDILDDQGHSIEPEMVIEWP